MRVLRKLKYPIAVGVFVILILYIGTETIVYNKYEALMQSKIFALSKISQECGERDYYFAKITDSVVRYKNGIAYSFFFEVSDNKNTSFIAIHTSGEYRIYGYRLHGFDIVGLEINC